MPYHYDYTVIGGDMRQVYLTEELAKSSGRICHFALCGVPDERLFSGAASVTAAASLKEACGLSPCIIGPIPLCRNGSFLNQTAFPDPIPIDLLFSGLRPGQALFGGCIFPGQQTVLQEKGVRAFDLMEDLTFSYYNTIATAEGAICEAIRQSPRNLRHSDCAAPGRACSQKKSFGGGKVPIPKRMIPPMRNCWGNA